MAGDGKMLCRHCGACPVSRPKGLCWGCYYTPEVRRLYPSTSKYAPKGDDAVILPTRPAVRPTPYRPGSFGKLLELRRRYLTGQELYHPADAPVGG